MGVYLRRAFISQFTNLENKKEVLVGHVPIELSRLKLASWYLGYMSLGESLGKWRECYATSCKKLKRNTAILNDISKKDAQNCKLPLDINLAFSFLSPSKHG